MQVNVLLIEYCICLIINYPYNSNINGDGNLFSARLVFMRYPAVSFRYEWINCDLVQLHATRKHISRNSLFENEFWRCIRIANTRAPTSTCESMKMEISFLRRAMKSKLPCFHYLYFVLSQINCDECELSKLLYRVIFFFFFNIFTLLI